jgi:hypothetical protein
MSTNIDKLIQLSNRKYGGYGYAAGYFASLVESMLTEFRAYGQYDRCEAYERQLAQMVKSLEDQNPLPNATTRSAMADAEAGRVIHAPDAQTFICMLN